MRKALLFVVMIALVPAGETTAETALTYGDLVARLYDLKRLAEPPAEGEKSGNWSSWHRGAKYNKETGRYENWHANRDGGGCIRMEGTDKVAAEMKGPGVIWRIWTALPKQGHIKIFIDGADKPTLDIPFKEYFNSKKGMFAYPELVHVLSRGHNSFVPIPYAKSCKVVLAKGWGAYYQITYTTFAKGTTVPSFTGSFSDADKAALTTANATLAGRGANPTLLRRDALMVKKDVEIPPGKTVEVCNLKGPQAITAIKVNVGMKGDDDMIRILRELALTIAWDGEAKPSVWTPLGDFFGTAPGINKYKSLPLGMTSEGFYSYWYMPFAKGASMKITNDGKKPRTVAVKITHQPLTKPVDKFLRFHAKWHRDAFPGVDKDVYLNGERWPDWPWLIVKGRGRFVGINLHVWNPNPFGKVRKSIPDGWPTTNKRIVGVMRAAAKGWWWGEGDEKFFVDGEKYPSTFGTGSEDYFGYAWAAHNPVEFESAFQNQPLNKNNSLGHVSNNRFQIADNVPFQTAFEACMEKYHPNEWPLLYSCTPYWYQQAGQADPYGPVPADQRVDYYVQPKKVVPKPVAGRYEGETLLAVKTCSGGKVQPQGMRGFGAGWSGDSHLLWKSGKKGDRLVLTFDVPENGRYTLKLQLTKAPDYGVFQFHLDGKKLAGPVDLYDPKIVPAPAIDAGKTGLDKGVHELKIEIVGANAAARPGSFGKYLLGLDYLKLTKAGK